MFHNKIVKRSLPFFYRIGSFNRFSPSRCLCPFYFVSCDFGCKTCGREEIERGCNGFGWWPIKAYRPCPGFVESGGRYRRRGQSMDEVAFGRGGRESSTGSSD
ncbi:unnamed protein product [Spirodela intermedia]|uniref:Uncharacterized protein n=1 Tax=Spirodela intermedia TaxID=51605 RepID=A0A7I8J6S8_SPIIN|nr:unnamed protein product [Spirodela intermedia]CAA6665744.1 unnamed protein product [Spirodela intermedia]